MTQTFDLNKMGLTPMNEFEMMEIEGGSFWKWLGAALCVASLFVTGGLSEPLFYAGLACFGIELLTD